MTAGSVRAEFFFLNTHPEASTVFPNSLGIMEIRAFNNRLYMGYGRNEARTTPQLCPPEDFYSFGGGRDFCEMQLRYLDPNNGSISASQDEMRTQGMFTMNEHFGNLYVLPDDPDAILGQPNGDVMLLRCNGPNCIDRFFQSNERSAHNYVSADYKGAIYHCCPVNLSH